MLQLRKIDSSVSPTEERDPLNFPREESISLTGTELLEGFAAAMESFVDMIQTFQASMTRDQIDKAYGLAELARRRYAVAREAAERHRLYHGRRNATYPIFEPQICDENYRLREEYAATTEAYAGIVKELRPAGDDGRLFFWLELAEQAEKECVKARRALDRHREQCGCHKFARSRARVDEACDASS